MKNIIIDWKWTNTTQAEKYTILKIVQKCERNEQKNVKFQTVPILFMKMSIINFVGAFHTKNGNILLSQCIKNRFHFAWTSAIVACTVHLNINAYF